MYLGAAGDFVAGVLARDVVSVEETEWIREGCFTVSMYSPLACLGGMIAQRWPEYCIKECRFMMRLWDLPWYGREELSSTVTLESCHGLSKSVMVVGAQTRSLLTHDQVS